MKNKKKLKVYFPSENIPAPDDNKIQQTIRLGQNYMGRNIPQKTPLFYLFLEQIKYLSPILWATQFLALIVIVFIAANGELNLSMAQSILFQVAPLTALFAVPELVKDVLFSMSELEKSCKNSSSTILLMRLIGVGCINLFALSLFAGIFAGSLGQNFFALMLYVLVPYNCVNIINLLFIRLFRIKGRGASLAVSLLSAAVVYVIPMQISFVDIASGQVLLTLFAGTTIILIVQIIKIFKSIPLGGIVAWN